MRRASALFSAFLMAVVLTVAAVRGDEASNVLRRDSGDVTVGFAGASPARLIGTISVPGAANATTGAKSLATLQLADSSEIRIGDRTSVNIGNLRKAADDPRVAVVTLNRGAIRFTVLHPEGARANYRFVTPTTQIAVRGTSGYLISGPAGDQVYCISCEGDVAVAGPFGVVSLHTGQTLNVGVRNGAVVSSEVVANPTVNNPAIDQFLGGKSPFGVPASLGSDPTGSGSGA